MNKTDFFLLNIVKSGIWNSPISEQSVLTLVELKRVIYFAKEHAVQGLVANAAVQGYFSLSDSRDNSKEMAVMNLMKVNLQHQRSYFRFEKALADFAHIMNKHGLQYVVFKGVAVARLYPQPYVRTMGDVDFYVSASDFDRAVEIIERDLHVEIEKEDIDKHFSFDYQGIRFEMHYQIETFGNGRHQRYFNRMIDGSIAKGADSFSIADTELDTDDVPVSVLPPTEDLIVVFKHWFNHLLVEGVGLRQTIDRKQSL